MKFKTSEHVFDIDLTMTTEVEYFQTKYHHAIPTRHFDIDWRHGFRTKLSKVRKYQET